MTMKMASKRSLLGFDDSGSENDEVPTEPMKRARVSKPIFKPSTTVETTTRKVGGPVMFTRAEGITNEVNDYLQMEIPEDDSTGPQRLSKDATMEEAAPDTMTRLKTSLFGQLVPDGSDPQSILTPLPIRPLKSKGLKMMEKMGFKVGDTLGKDSHNKTALLEPILVIPRGNHKTGIGMVDNGVKENQMTEQDENEFKKRNHDEKYQAKLERILRKMQKQCFEFEDVDAALDIEKVNLMDLNVMWRGYVKFIQDVIKRKKEQQVLLDENGDRLQEVNDTESTTSNNQDNEDNDEQEDNEDEELKIFEQQLLEEKITRLNAHLRSDYNYCFYCGVRYEDQEDLFSNCPGSTEEEHL